VVISDFINENKPLQLFCIYFHFLHFRSLLFCSIADTVDMVEIKAQNLKDTQFGIYDADTDELLEGGIPDRGLALDMAFEYTNRGERVEVRIQPTKG